MAGHHPWKDIPRKRDDTMLGKAQASEALARDIKRTIEEHDLLLDVPLWYLYHDALAEKLVALGWRKV